MSALYLLLALLAALAFYLATLHQRLYPVSPVCALRLRVLGWVTTVLALAAAIVDLGLWSGVFCAMTAFMLAAVALPYLDAWRLLSRERGDVG